MYGKTVVPEDPSRKILAFRRGKPIVRFPKPRSVNIYFIACFYFTLYNNASK